MHDNINACGCLGSVLLGVRVSWCIEFGLWESGYGGFIFSLVKIEFLGKDEVLHFQSLLFIFLLSFFSFCTQIFEVLKCILARAA